MGIFSFIANKLIDKRIKEYQSDLITRHYDEVNSMYIKMRAWRHDYHNHMQIMKAYMSLGQYDKVSDYLCELEDELHNVDTVVKTGNIMVDAILNSKLTLINSRNIETKVRVKVPENINISEMDLCTILGNLLDNALEASEKVEKPIIRIYMGILKGQLYISVANAVSSQLKRRGDRFLSTKNSSNHGFGLMTVDSIVRKYDGYLNRQSEGGIFATEILLPLNKV